MPPTAPDLPIPTRLADLGPGHVDAGPGCTTLHLGRAGGARQLYASLDRLAPGACSAKLHAHTEREEFFFVLRGTVLLRTDRGDKYLGPGDFFCKPAGVGLAHQFVNDTLVDAEILDVGLVAPADVVLYPDDRVALVKSLGLAFRTADALGTWSSDPDATAADPEAP